MSFADMLKPRPEVLSDEGIDGIIDLANLEDPKGKKLEANPKRFFALTYPTADVHRIIQKLSDRFAGRDAPGLFLFEGLKGSGKSHLLLLVYHLFKNPKEAKGWLDANEIYCELPDDVIVVVNKFTDLPLYSIWDFIFEKIAEKSPKKSVVQPGLKEIDELLEDKKLILILDELEQGIRVIEDSSLKAQNIAFLQMMSEWANRSDKVTIFASIYSDQDEPGSTLKRVPSCRVQFAHSPDKAKVILHRLFKNYLGFDFETCASTVDSYLNSWRRHSVTSTEEYRSRMLLTYPFLPEVLDLILDRVPARGGFQSVRGALGFLANMVRLSYPESDLISAGHASLNDREVATRLSDLDPSGDLVSKARSNANDLKEQPLSSDVAATVMLYTLTSSGRNKGATREEILKHVVTPRTDINDFEKTMLAFQKYASNFHIQEGRYFFDLEENAEAKIEFRSLTIDPEETKARKLLHELWCDEIFKEPNATIYQGDEETKEALDELDKNRLRYLLSPRRLSQEERHDLYHGVSNRNIVILLEPKDLKFNMNSHRDLLKWAKRQLAARDLAGTARDSARRVEYERIAREDKNHCLDTIKRAGLVFIRWEHYGESAEEDRIEEETIPGSSKEDVHRYLSQRLFPTQLFEEHLLGRMSNLLNVHVRDIDKQYRSTLGFPIPTTIRSVSQALRELCRRVQISIRHSRGNFCGENPDLTETELFDATVGEPLEKGVMRPSDLFPKEDEGVAPHVEVEGERPAIEGGEGGLVVTPPAVTVSRQEISIPPQTGAGELRQAVADRLQEFPDAKARRVRATIFFEKSTGDLSILPPAIRGNLSGEGSMTAELTVTKDGEFSKSDVEQIIESLPSLPGADYAARLDVEIPSSQEGKENE